MNAQQEFDHHAEHFRQHAATCRRRANEATDEFIREHWILLAEEYERLIGHLGQLKLIE
jgi:hypothetical protein